MTLEISRDVALKSGFANNINITVGNEQRYIDLKDFLVGCYYVLINSDLEENDPRIDFIKIVKQLNIAQGMNGSESTGLVYKKRELTDSFAYPEDYHNL